MSAYGRQILKATLEELARQTGDGQMTVAEYRAIALQARQLIWSAEVAS